MRGWLGAILPLCAAAAAVAQDVRIIAPLDAGWRFMRAPQVLGAEMPAFDDATWDAVTVPHTWNRIGNEGTQRSPDSSDVQGVGWYRLHFEAPPIGGGARYFLQFNAVGTVADVWLNGRYLGKHAGAFSKFRFDVSAAIKSSGTNVLVVKADNSRPQPGSGTQDVIPLSGDFFMFGGIYRNVSLIVTNSVHVDMLDFGGPGLYVRALDVEAAAANVVASGRIVNQLKIAQRVAVEFAIKDATGATVAVRSFKTTAAPGSAAIQAQLRVEHPRLWQGVEDPYLYRAVMTIRSKRGAILDSVSQPLGLRSVKFDAENGFFLNGKHVFLRGASMHQDRPVKGWAISAADQRQDFDLLQELGANAVRLAHYQHDDYSYTLADTLGILAWAEIPLVNKVSFDGSPANTALTANAQQQLTELVRQNYNHPSIVVWSIGNEIDLTATMIHGPSNPTALVKSLNTLAKREDPLAPRRWRIAARPAVPLLRAASLWWGSPTLSAITDTSGGTRGRSRISARCWTMPIRAIPSCPCPCPNMAPVRHLPSIPTMHAAVRSIFMADRIPKSTKLGITRNLGPRSRRAGICGALSSGIFSTSPAIIARKAT